MRQHPEKLPCRLFLFRYASKIAVANNYNKECRVLIENGDKDGEVPPDTIVEPCQISWLAIFASEFLLSKQSGCLSRCVFFPNSVATIWNRKKKHKNSLYWCQVSCWKLMSTSGFRCGDPWFAILVGGLTSWGGCAPPPRICIVDPFVCDCFTPSISYITCKCIKQQKHGKKTSKAPLKLWDTNETHKTSKIEKIKNNSHRLLAKLSPTQDVQMYCGSRNCVAQAVWRKHKMYNQDGYRMISKHSNL